MRSAVVSIKLILRFVLCCGGGPQRASLSPLSDSLARAADGQRHQGEGAGAGAAGSSPDPAQLRPRPAQAHLSVSRRARHSTNTYGEQLSFSLSRPHVTQGGIPLLNKLSYHNTHRTLATLTIEAHMRHARHANIRYTRQHAYAWGPCPINKSTVHSCSLQT